MTSTFNFPKVPHLRRQAIRVAATVLIAVVFSLGVRVTLAQEPSPTVGTDAAPTGLANEDGIYVTWGDNSLGELGFEIEMRDEEGGLVGTFQVGPDETRSTC